MSQCRSCGARIEWVTMSSTGASMPVDSIPDAGGTIRSGSPSAAIVVGEVLTGMFLDAARLSGTDLYRSHFATCPHADRHRGGR